MQDLDKVGAAFGDNQMSFETLESQSAKDFVNIINLECKRKISWPSNSDVDVASSMRRKLSRKCWLCT